MICPALCLNREMFVVFIDLIAMYLYAICLNSDLIVNFFF